MWDGWDVWGVWDIVPAFAPNIACRSARQERESERVSGFGKKREPSASLVKRAVASWSHPCMFWLEMCCHICVVMFGVAQTTSSVVGLNLIPFHTRV